MDGTKAFLQQYTRRRGDYTKEKYDHPQFTLDEVLVAMRSTDKEEMDGAAM
ncbi:MAG: hypothetical protein LBB74_03475 [Chitinispirillales bacterium]|nr:hypothetical protein [Chitinispirillales bacterium]